MNQTLLTRLFKTIEGTPNSPIVKIALSIIEDEKRKGHNILADRLAALLTNNIVLKDDFKPSFKITKEQVYKIPVDRRYQLPLASNIEHNILRHEMVLSEEVEKKIARIENEFLARERLAHHGLKPRKKILFYGHSGCGKSMAAEKIAWDLGLPFYKVRFDTIISSYLGESASNLQKLFESLKNFPCVLLLDEFDIIGKKRNSSSNDVGEIIRIVNILLGLLEEYDGNGILIATTNMECNLDNALFRRFDDFIELTKPSENEITELLKKSLFPMKLSKNINFSSFSKKMLGMSYAIIVKIANDAAKSAIINSANEVTRNNLQTAFEENKRFNR